MKLFINDVELSWNIITIIFINTKCSKYLKMQEFKDAM